MLSLKIQQFGGRGSRSGLGVGGPGVGFIDFINAVAGAGDIPLPEYDNYPDFPDPDYSKYKLQTNDNFIKQTFSLLNYKRTEHDVTAQKYLKSLGINKNIKYSNLNDGSSVGYVESIVDLDGNMRVYKFNLNKADTRRMEYKVKTMIHEGYHASNDGLQYPGGKLSRPVARFHEETRTEMSAMFLAKKLNGYDYVPSYTLEVVSAAAKYKRLEEYKHCKTLSDLGEVFYRERMVNRTNTSYEQIDKKFNAVKLDDNYYKRYYNRIVNNSEKYYEACKNSLFNFRYFDTNYVGRYKSSFDSMISKIKNNEKLTSGLEKRQFVMCVALSMNDGGIL